MKNSYRRIKALIIKEFYQIIYDPSSILISIVLPVILLFLYGFGVSLDLNNVNIGLVMEDSSPDAQSFAQTLTGSPNFNVHIAYDSRAMIDPLLSGQIRGFVVIPSYFSAFRHSTATRAPIQVITDGGEPNTANFVQNYVAQVWTKWLEQEKINKDLKGFPLIHTQPRFWYNEAVDSRNFLVPGSLAIIMTLIGTLLTALVIAREWERGTMEALMATPVHITEILLAKLITYFGMGMLSMACCVAGTVLIYGIPFRGSLIVLAIVTSAFLLTALGIGLLISTLTKNQLAASQAAQVAAFLPAYILSGFMFEIASMPPVIRFVTYFVPARYFIRSLLSIFLVGNVWEIVIYDTLIMFLLGCAIFYVNAKLTVKRLD
jgi:ABC-2 type transport system permease protein